MNNHYLVDTSGLPRELKALLACLREDDADPFPETEEWPSDLDWDLFLRLARHHRVYPSIYRKLKQRQVACGVPAHVVQSLYQEYRKNTFQMLHLSREMEQVCRSLTDNCIRVLLLKGPALAADLYGDISFRTSRDLDLLVHINDLEQADEVLIHSGYLKDEYFSTKLNEWRWRHHHISYFHPEKKVRVELHWRLNPGPSLEPGFDELWARRRASSLTSFPVQILGREDLFLYLVSHGARHGWSRLRWLADIQQMTRWNMDWRKLELLLERYQCRSLGGQALILATQLLRMPLAQELKPLTEGTRPKRLAQDAMFYVRQMVNLHTFPVPAEVARYHKRHLFRLMPTGQKLLFLLSFFYPYPEDTQALPLPKRLHFLYFPLRPVLWAWRKTRKHVFRGIPG